MRLDENVIRCFALGRVFKNQVRAVVIGCSSATADRVYFGSKKGLSAYCSAATPLSRFEMLSRHDHARCSTRTSSASPALLPPTAAAACILCRCLQGPDPTARINSISFHRTEDLLVSASDDDTIRLYNTQTGSESK